MRLLIAGADGQVAQALTEAARYAADLIAVAAGRPELDLSLPETVRRLVADFAPDVVINAAAYTAVDRAEQESDLAYLINCDGARHLAEAAKACGAAIIHLSTDYVFDGGKPSPYVEDDETAPLNVYGRSKRAGEIAIMSANPRHVIVRTSWVYSATGSNFVKTMLRQASERTELRIVDDQIGSPTYAPHLAEVLIAVAQRIMQFDDPQQFGVFHAAGSGGAVSWCGLARAVFADAGVFGVKAPVIVPITTDEYPTLARRPTNSQLDCGKLERVYGLSLPPWREGVAECVRCLSE
jgi:dTDP-4-dehydrorhamnose reductase